MQQVRHNLESGRRQYGLQDRARELGFVEVVVIDEDLGVLKFKVFVRQGPFSAPALGQVGLGSVLEFDIGLLELGRTSGDPMAQFLVEPADFLFRLLAFGDVTTTARHSWPSLELLASIRV